MASVMALAALITTAAPRAHAQVAGGFQVVQPDSQASAMMMALIDEENVMIIDKAENNRAKLNNGQPVWGTVMSLTDYSVRALDMTTNPFCASGAQLGNGTWMVAGGNHAVGYGGGLLGSVAPADGPYQDLDGGQAIRVMEPQNNSANLAWIDNANAMSSVRWYPGIEVMTDGSVLLIGGATGGGYINRNYPNVDPAYQGGGSNPTWEFFPSKGNTPTPMTFMVATSGLNMYPHTYLMPSGKLFMQANYSTALWQPYANNEATAYNWLDNMPEEIVRVYPASGAVAMLPLTPSNNYTPTILFCGGSIISDEQWGDYAGPNVNLYQTPAQTDCSSITPEDANGNLVSQSYVHEENLPEPRSMGQFIHLPTGQMVIVNGASYGTAGYTNATWNKINGINYEGCSNNPTYQPIMYDPSKPQGSRLSRDGFGSSTIARLYHSSAILVPDGSILIGGSNPHQDVSLNMPTGTTPQAFNTTYEIEKWYPPYYFETRPAPQGLPEYILYGGNTWNFTMDANFMGSSANYKANNTKVMVIRPGFSTHAMNMGQRSLQLQHTYTVNGDGTVTYEVMPMPTNQNIFVQGPALLFVTIDGVPSVGKYVQIGSQSFGAFTVPNNIKSNAAPSALASPVNNPSFNAIPANVSGSSSNGALIGGIVGGVVGAIAIIALIVLLVCCRRRRQRRGAYQKGQTEDIYGVSPYAGAAGVGAAAGGRTPSMAQNQHHLSHQYAAVTTQPGTPASSHYDKNTPHFEYTGNGLPGSGRPSYSSNVIPAAPGSPYTGSPRPHAASPQPYSSGDQYRQ
jgi:hypothetical protein